MAKHEWLPELINRKRRILGRKILGKHLPTYVYRIDGRSPATIRALGFQPWNGAGNVTMMEHVNGSFGPNHAMAGQMSKLHSQYVSTGAYGLLKRIDPTFAMQLPQKNVYKIDAQAALGTGPFHDANDHFDRAGSDRPYSTQREWIKLGGIDQQAVIEYMTGQAFLAQLNAQYVAPDENQLAGWQVF